MALLLAPWFITCYTYTRHMLVITIDKSNIKIIQKKKLNYAIRYAFEIKEMDVSPK
jgi:hypothetical protein